MDKQWLIEYCWDEIEETKRRLRLVPRQSEPSERVSMHHFFPSLKPGRANSVTGAAVTEQIPFTPGMYVHIPPYQEAALFEQSAGCSVEHFVELCNRGVVQPYVNSFLDRYVGIDWVDPILKLRPPTYVRFAGFFDANAEEGKYYAKYMEGLARFRGKLDEHPAMRRWPQVYHNARRAFEAKVAFDYARVSILFPELEADLLAHPAALDQADDILLMDAHLVDPRTNAFDQFFRLNPSDLEGGWGPMTRPFEAGVGKTVVDGFKIRYPRDVDVDTLIALTRSGAWQKGVRLCEELARATVAEAERVQDNALALPNVWSETAGFVRAHQRRIDKASETTATVALGAVGVAAGVLMQDAGWLEALHAYEARLANRLREVLQRIPLSSKTPLHLAAAWDYHVEVGKAKGQ